MQDKIAMNLENKQTYICLIIQQQVYICNHYASRANNALRNTQLNLITLLTQSETGQNLRKQFSFKTPEVQNPRSNFPFVIR